VKIKNTVSFINHWTLYNNLMMKNVYTRSMTNCWLRTDGWRSNSRR